MRHRNELDLAPKVANHAIDAVKQSGDVGLLDECLIALADIYYDKEGLFAGRITLSTDSGSL